MFVVAAEAGLSGIGEKTLRLAIGGGDRGVEDHSLSEAVEPGMLCHSLRLESNSHRYLCQGHMDFFHVIAWSAQSIIERYRDTLNGCQHSQAKQTRTALKILREKIFA